MGYAMRFFVWMSELILIILYRIGLYSFGILIVHYAYNENMRFIIKTMME